MLTPPGRPRDLCVSTLLSKDLRCASTPSPEARCVSLAAGADYSAVSAAFPIQPGGTPTTGAPATACVVPFILDSILALRAADPVPDRIIHDLFRGSSFVR